MIMNYYFKNGQKKRAGFTITEVLLATSIFTIVGIIGITVFVNVIRTQRRVALENAIYEDTRFMMQRISREIRQNTVDYEEYYNKALKNNNLYGNRYGCYASRFYNPGSEGGPKRGGFGAWCNDSSTAATPDCVIKKDTLDITTGQNPYVKKSSSPTDANAFCDKIFSSATPCTSKLMPQNELYLINPQGKEKTLFARKKINGDEYSLALLRLTGEDTDNDGVVEDWQTCGVTKRPLCCSQGFDCNLPSSSLESTLSDTTLLDKGFISISPTRTNIKSISFYIAPFEDPRKAFAEEDLIQQQPHVTVIMTVVPSKTVLQGYGGTPPEITLQSTIVSRVDHEVRSFNLKTESLCEAY